MINIVLLTSTADLFVYKRFSSKKTLMYVLGEFLVVLKQ